MVVIVDSKLVSSAVLNQLNQDKEVRLSQSGDILRKTEKQVGGRIGKLLGFRVRTVYENLSKGGKTTTPERTHNLNSQKSREAIITFLRKQVQAQAPSFPLAVNTHEQDHKYHYDHLLQDLQKPSKANDQVSSQFVSALQKTNDAQKKIDVLERQGVDNPHFSFNDTDIQRTVRQINETIDLTHNEDAQPARRKWYTPIANFLRSFG
ncbi:MAG: hypothetical protein GDA54_01725 [Alphaproteobacteria bacterium GM7ARS4]|nr:hypothetical protein [Alphaproteobacteria bacterium GM7ARS4]